MLHTPRARRGMVVAPHSLASEAGLAVLREGGNAIEAGVATASTLAVVYPHMTGIGGDAFWIAKPANGPVRYIGGCGAAGADPDHYAARGLDQIPTRGPDAALTVAGAVSSWSAALALSAREWSGSMPLDRLLDEAIWHAESGYPVTASQAAVTAARRDELADLPGFADTFLQDGAARAVGAVETQPRLARSLRCLAADGLDGFYDGELAAAIAADLAQVGSPVSADDLSAHQVEQGAPLSCRVGSATVYNSRPPTQGLVSLIILALAERLGVPDWPVDSPEAIHRLVEATKQAFRLRDESLHDPDMMPTPVEDLLDPAFLDELAARVDPDKAEPWGEPGEPGDTTWFGVIDEQGNAVSVIQSIYHEYGSGVVLPETGICWQNRGLAFSLDPDAPRGLQRGRRPFHTLNPPLACFDDGRTMVYGTMGGDGQPQTQTALFARQVWNGDEPQAAVTAPRWLLGRTWGNASTSLKLESRFDPAIPQRLAGMGHRVEVVGDYDEMMGHAGMIVRSPDGILAGGADPRGNGGVAGF
ncbi:gamma-glutamyltransferase family protein [Guyparkeria hydrothermalis]|uniref:gamma-glutamyltransferase family protein n=1 Tax=Guyparkeria hydrothermalis TaxID=923 RepID=UPI0020200FDB|nr:gamma-glutamyltransferase family protein [Guyparkeria hydrothermalis]MCL7743573.1 gamma-glutamyltransferase family protein [Guyparkeria hydrothermalis]